MSNYLPEEVIIEILLQLPAKSVLKFRCVCKTWWSMISSRHFVTRYLARSNQHRPSYLLFRHYDHEERFTLHPSDDPFPCSNPAIHPLPLLKGDEIQEKRSFFEYPSNFTELHCPYKHKYTFPSYFNIVGSVNGLICLANNYTVDGAYHLWNPSINRLVLLPYPNIRKKSHGQYTLSLGLGYHAPTTDYKLVKFVYFDDFIPLVVEIYTLHTGVWRFVIGPDPQYIVGNTSVFVNGALHWLARTPEKSISFQNLILSFDLGDEVFHEVLLPKILEESYPRKKLAIAALDGLLAIHGGQLEYSGDRGWVVKEYCVWVMKEYGVVESWTKLYTIDVGERFGERFRGVVGFKTNGDILVATRDIREDLLLYEPISQRTWKIYIHSLLDSFYLDNYVESLELLDATDRV